MVTEQVSGRPCRVAGEANQISGRTQPHNSRTCPAQSAHFPHYPMRIGQKMLVIADFRVKERAEMDGKLNTAVEAAQREADADRTCGLLVTRHSFDHFSVALSPDVPFRIIRENDASRRP